MSKVSLNDLNILTLRELARQVGVATPTSKKKDQLIDEIIKIQSGKMQPYSAKTKQGRPPKSAIYDFSDLVEFQNFLRPSNSIVTLRQETKFENCDIITKQGHIELLSNNSAFLWVNENFNNTRYFVNAEFVKNFNLKTGDLVLASVPESDVFVVQDIFNINGNAILELPKIKKEYNKIDAQIPCTALEWNAEKFNSLNIKQGENVYFYGADNNLNTKTTIDLLQNCVADTRIYINLSIAPKNKMYFEGVKGVEFITASLTDTNDFARLMVKVAIERAKRVLEQNKTVVVAVDDMLAVTSIDSPDLELTKELVTLAKDGKRSGKITLFAVMPADRNINQIEKLADCRFKIDTDIITKL